MKKQILLITGRNSAQLIKGQLRKNKILAEVYQMPVDVSAFITKDMILKELAGKNLRNISAIIVPSAIRGDISAVAKRLKIHCYKGPSQIIDLPYIIKNIYKIQLSTTKSADFFIKEQIYRRNEQELKEAYRKKKKFKLKIGTKSPVFIGYDYPIRLISEIVDAPRLSDREILKIARYYKKFGTDIIDIGMISGEDNSEKIPNIVKILCNVNLPLSIDSSNMNEILTSVKSGIDLVLSIDETNYKIADSIDVPIVVIPRDKNGVIPKKAEERIKLLVKLISKLENKKIIADPVLSPLNSGFTESIKSYIIFRRKYPEIPLMLGVGNVTELLDADSIGVNALLAGIASEMGIELIFTTEGSVKTRGAVKELSIAIRMMYLSKKRSQLPKDLGIDLLVAKKKR